MNGIVATHTTEIQRIRLHSRGLVLLDIPLAEASRPFSESRLLKSAVVSVQAAKPVITSRSQYKRIEKFRHLKTYL